MILDPGFGGMRAEGSRVQGIDFQNQGRSKPGVEASCILRTREGVHKLQSLATSEARKARILVIKRCLDF